MMNFTTCKSEVTVNKRHWRSHPICEIKWLHRSKEQLEDIWWRKDNWYCDNEPFQALLPICYINFHLHPCDLPHFLVLSIIPFKYTSAFFYFRSYEGARKKLPSGFFLLWWFSALFRFSSSYSIFNIWGPPSSPRVILHLAGRWGAKSGGRIGGMGLDGHHRLSVF